MKKSELKSVIKEVIKEELSINEVKTPSDKAQKMIDTVKKMTDRTDKFIVYLNNLKHERGI